MLNNIQTQFTIKDLENLSGIKAHTIRIWEKRYDILSPSRTDSNIRFYDIQGLQKLLNVTLLYNKGYKISKIGQLDDKDLIVTVRSEIAKSEDNTHFFSSLKLSMLNFDQSLFEHTYNKLVSERSFREIFVDVFIPLLTEVGLLWQSNSITPAHEHFISNLIKQKLLLNIERVQQSPAENIDKVFVLYLPSQEIHELGLLYIHYELGLKGYKSIYLGQSVPIESLLAVTKIYKELTFVSYFTIKPDISEIPGYIEEMNDQILEGTSNDLLLLGRNLRDVTIEHSKIKVFNDLRDLINIF